MPRGYLNQREREHIGITMALHEQLKEYYDTMDSNERKFLKLSTTYYTKFISELMLRVGPTVGRKMVNDFKGANVRYTSAKQTEKRTVTLDAESLGDLAEGVIHAFCTVCKNPSKDMCSIREIFIACEVDTNPDFKSCPYYPL